MNSTYGGRTLCVVVCAAGPAGRVARLVDLAQQTDWTVRVVATPQAVSFIDIDAIAELCGSPVRSDYRTPQDTGPRSRTADAIIMAPATYNSINKLAAGINDTYALNVVAEAIGRGTPVAVLPFVNTALAARRPFRRAVTSLRDEGVNVIFGPDQWSPHPPGDGDQHLDRYPWHLTLTAIARPPVGSGDVATKRST